jgi:hypothetical protein
MLIISIALLLFDNLIKGALCNLEESLIFYLNIFSLDIFKNLSNELLGV